MRDKLTQVIFGDAEVTTGAGGDLQQVASMAKQMVEVFGMSDIGPWALQDPSSRSGDVIMRMMARNSMSEKLAKGVQPKKSIVLPWRGREIEGGNSETEPNLPNDAQTLITR